MKQKLFSRISALFLAAVMLLALPAGAVSYDEEGNEITVIVLDPGHGGSDPGTVAEHGGVEVWESTLNLKIADYCRDYLEEHYEHVRVLLTREEDVRVSLEERVDFAVEAEADYLLSIHLNSNDGRAKGALAIVPRGRYRPEQAAASTVTAEAILVHLAELGLTNRGTMYTTNTDRYPDGSYKDSFAIVRGGVQNNIPAVIMEHAFLDNAVDYVNHLNSEEKLEALGIADALGLAETLGLQEKLPELPDLPELPEEPEGMPFTDVSEEAWFHDAVEYVWEEGLMQGISENAFGPTLPANRAMVVTLLYRMDGTDYLPEVCSFEDVEAGSWYHAPVEWALLNGITTGVSETEFAPGRNVIREQFVTFLHRYAGSPEPGTLPEHFTDWEEVSGYAQPSMAWAVELGLLTGYDDGTVRPLRELNRAELAVLMQRFHRWYLHDTGEVPYEWTVSPSEMSLFVGESFELSVTNQYGETADVLWTADTEGVVQIDGSAVTAIGVGTALLYAELEGQIFECWVEVTEKIPVWTISREEASIEVGESFELSVTNQYGETADVQWTADTEGVVQIDGSTVTAVGVGTVILSAELEGQVFQCLVEVTERVLIWTVSQEEASLQVGESFELTIMNQYGEIADVLWAADAEGVVEVNGTTVTAIAEGTVLLSAEVDGEWFDCFVTVTEKQHTWTISHTDVTIKVGESFNLRLRNEEGEAADVDWTASKSGYVTISGNKITGKAKGTVNVTCEFEGQTYKCIVRVKNA